MPDALPVVLTLHVELHAVGRVVGGPHVPVIAPVEDNTLHDLATEVDANTGMFRIHCTNGRELVLIIRRGNHPIRRTGANSLSGSQVELGVHVVRLPRLPQQLNHTQLVVVCDAIPVGDQNLGEYVHGHLGERGLNFQDARLRR